MNIQKVNGIISITEGKLNITRLIDNGTEVTNDITKFLLIRDIIDNALVQFEVENQAKFKNIKEYILPKNIYYENNN